MAPSGAFKGAAHEKNFTPIRQRKMGRTLGPTLRPETVDDQSFAPEWPEVRSEVLSHFRVQAGAHGSESDERWCRRRRLLRAYTCASSSTSAPVAPSPANRFGIAVVPLWWGT